MRHLSLIATVALGSACNANLFSLEDDIELGQQLRDEVNSDTKNFNVVDPADAPDAYDHLDRMLAQILASDAIEYRDEFDWEIYLINDDETLNAFAAPGGYMWVYTGLIKFLDTEDDLVGVLGHEVAHADKRHGTQALTAQYGTSVLLTLLLGEDPGLLAQIAASLGQLRFSRENESESDEFSVRYLCDTDYAANGAAGFFQKLEEKGAGGVPEFLSTHPNPANRVEAINDLAAKLACSTDPNPNVSYDAFVASLPPPPKP